MVQQIEQYFYVNRLCTNLTLRWDAFKACLRGTFIAEIMAVKRNSLALLEQVEDQVGKLELAFVTDPSDSTREAWISGQDSLDRLRASTERGFSISKLSMRKGRKTAICWPELPDLSRRPRLSELFVALRDDW